MMQTIALGRSEVVSIRPLAIDLFCGLGGWAEGFLVEGYSVIGFDIKKHDYGNGSYPGQLVLQDVTTLHGSQFKDAAVIVASPPCTEYSYMAMPWSRAKQIAKALRRKGEFPEGYTGSRTIEELNRLFMACFRIQREASEAAGRDIPLVVENVRGAQPWVGQANAEYGSFLLWGDVRRIGRKIVTLLDVERAKVDHSFRTPYLLAPEPRSEPKQPGQKRNPDGTDHGSGSWFKIADSKNRGARKVPGISFNGELGQTSPGFNVTAAQRYREAQEQRGSKRISIGSASWHAEKGQPRNTNDPRNYFSKSDSRKAASAEIAKIPFPLARYIAQVFKP
jgi:C-5 cytosine-specific DNA methylase